MSLGKLEMCVFPFLKDTPAVIYGMVCRNIKEEIGRWDYETYLNKIFMRILTRSVVLENEKGGQI